MPAERRFLEEPILLVATGRQQPIDAVKAILVLDDGRYLMQLRDPKPEILYPDHWGCFGGAVDGGEDPKQALLRELREELEFEAGSALEFTRFYFDVRRLEQERVYRIYYEITVSAAAFARFVLHEGAAIGAFTAAEILQQPQVIPYDAYAIWLHCRRERFRS